MILFIYLFILKKKQQQQNFLESVHAFATRVL